MLGGSRSASQHLHSSRLPLSRRHQLCFLQRLDAAESPGEATRLGMVIHFCGSAVRGLAHHRPAKGDRRYTTRASVKLSQLNELTKTVAENTLHMPKRVRGNKTAAHRQSFPELLAEAQRSLV